MRILFLCTGNSCRSQMAEGFARAIATPETDIWSAGTRPAEAVSPLAVSVMRERGLSLEGQRPKLVDKVPAPVDVAITLCDSASAECTTYHGARQVEHWGLPDPADATGTDEERLPVFRASRDTIEARVRDLLTRVGAHRA